MPGYTGQARPVASGFCLRVRALFGGRLGGRRWSFWFEGVEPLVVFRSDRTVRGMVQLRMERGLGQVDSIKSGQTWVYRHQGWLPSIQCENGAEALAGWPLPGLRVRDLLRGGVGGSKGNRRAKCPNLLPRKHPGLGAAITHFIRGETD